jgi:hypothetical protein
MNGVGESHYFRHLETDRHNQNCKKHGPYIVVEQAQPHKKTQRKYRNAEHRKNLVVKGIITVQYFVPDCKRQIERIERLSKWIGVERKARAFRRGPQWETKIAKMC